MSGSTTKKVIIRRFDREALTGFVNPDNYLQESGAELLTPSGAVLTVPYEEIKMVCFVRDFEAALAVPQEKRIFFTRPKLDGVWVRMRFRDGEVADGLLPKDLLHLPASGFALLPPDPNSNVQRLFVPRTALREIKVLGVVGARRKAPPAPRIPDQQIGLFDA